MTDVKSRQQLFRISRGPVAGRIHRQIVERMAPVQRFPTEVVRCSRCGDVTVRNTESGEGRHPALVSWRQVEQGWLCPACARRAQDLTPTPLLEGEGNGGNNG